MPPRNAKASTSTAGNPRKRRQSDQTSTSSTSKSTPLLPPSASLGTLDFGSDGELDQDDGDVLDQDSAEEGEEEAFPEVNLAGSEDEQDDSFDGSADEEDFEDEDEDEEALLAELEDEEEEDLLTSEEDPSDLDEMIRRHTSKPIEDDAPTPFTSRELLEEQGVMRDYMKRSRTIKSKLTGKEKTVWDDEIDADYGSDSSTEEVSFPLCLNCLEYWV